MKRYSNTNLVDRPPARSRADWQCRSSPSLRSSQPTSVKDPQMTDGWMTLRPTSGPVGEVYAHHEHLGERMLEWLVDGLDGGEGWSWGDESGVSWLFGQRSLTLTVRADPETGEEFVDASVVVTEQVTSLSDDLALLLNHLNKWSFGWLYWFDPTSGSIVSTSRARVAQAEWWWGVVMNRLLSHQVNAAEVAAPLIAATAGGVEAVRSHPARGTRPDLDGWLGGVRLGPIDLSSALDQFISWYDVLRFVDTLEDIAATSVELVDVSFVAGFDDRRGAPERWIHKVWNPHVGWSWQFAHIDGHPDECDPNDAVALARDAAHRNTKIGLSVESRCRFGGWLAADNIGLVSRSIVLPMAMEEVLDHSGETAGSAVAFMSWILNDGPISTPGPKDWRSAISALHRIDFAGPWSPVLPPSNNDGDDDAERDSTAFASPRDDIVCVWGIFNPNGPTVGSIELSYSNAGAIVWYVQRHPHVPDIRPLLEYVGDLQSEDFNQVLQTTIFDAMANPDESILGTWPHFMVIYADQLSTPIHDGFIAHAVATRTAQSMIMAAEALDCGADDPWYRVTRRMNETQVTDEHSDGDEGFAGSPEDAAEQLWNVVTSPDVVAGHQLFMRSAWEGAQAYRQSGWDPAVAQGTTDAIVYRNRNRALADFHFRQQQQPLVRSATGHILLNDQGPAEDE